LFGEYAHPFLELRNIGPVQSDKSLPVKEEKSRKIPKLD
jgi:hypothetical protein